MPSNHTARSIVLQPEGEPAPPPSKTRRKRDMHELQALGEALVALDGPRLASLDLPEELADAIRFAHTLRKHEAKRRHMQYIGHLMRDVDAEPIRAALSRMQEGPAPERARFAALELWSERILDEPGGLQAFLDAHPGASRERLVPLVDAAREERARHARPHRYRALFRELERLYDRGSR
ncbi:MAG TPA: ribosome biogenesis factor YjgA [Casimicrobiaceae bacterium]